MNKAGTPKNSAAANPPGQRIVNVPDIELNRLDTQQLMGLYADLLSELTARGSIRTRNAPLGDLSEKLVAVAYGGKLEPNSKKSSDVTLPDDTAIQVKSRAIAAIGGGSQVFSPFRSWDFDRCVFLRFDITTYALLSAVDTPQIGLQEISSRSEWIRGNRIRVSADLLAIPGARDVTGQIAAAYAELDSYVIEGMT